MVFVRVSETYDLSTKVNKMGIVAIHTPKSDLIFKHWKGFFMNCEKYRLVSCDVAMACASMLLVDPLQIGVEAGSIAPQDMFNPILYKAVSNDSMNSFLQFMYGQDISPLEGVTALSKNFVLDVHDTSFSSANGVAVDQFSMYYSLLSNSDGWKKAMPQAGLSMKGLYPLVFQRLSNVGFVGRSQPNDESVGNVPRLLDTVTDSSVISNYAQYMRGHAVRMPAIPTVCVDSNPNNANIDGIRYHGLDPYFIPSCYVGLIILPPAKLNQLYYRLKITWTVEFTGPRSLTDISNWSNMATVGALSYGTDYEAQASKMSVTTNLVDTDGADVTKVMEGST